tara:strand:+ start:879 stop:1550 length:672 start_codon:yes stop_codon:yes gene_type:complete
MKIILSIVLVLISSLTSAQIKVNEELKNELLEINNNDQILRRIYFIKEEYKSKSDSLKKLFKVDDVALKEILRKNIIKNDSINILKIEKIIEKYGYPGKSLVGEKESDVAWAVIQHSTLDKQKKYLNLLKITADKNEIPFTTYALTLDRILMEENKPQKYGSQGKVVVLSKTKEKELIIWPIENPKYVNKLRRKVGFDESIKKYAKHLGIKYKVYSIEDIYLP